MGKFGAEKMILLLLLLNIALTIKHVSSLDMLKTDQVLVKSAIQVRNRTRLYV